MAVPPIERSQKAAAAGPTRAVRFPWLLDVLLGLLIVAALPLAIVAIPNTVSVVADLLPAGIDRIGLMRAHGLALPAMMLTVPLAAVALRRMNVAHILVGGLTLLALADAAGGFAGSTFFVAVLRVLHGVGAGIVIPATMVAAWNRPPVLRAVWASMLAVSLLSAQALALWPLDGAENWKITLQPFPMLSGIGLALAALYLVVWLVRGENPASAPRAAERSRLLLAAVPAAAIAVLAITSASDSWPPGLVVLVALLSVAALLALASIGTFEGPAGRSLAYATVAVGIVLLPSVAQLTYIEMGGLGGPGLKGLWQPFVLAALAGVGAAVGVVRWGGSAKWLTPAGLFLIVLGLCTVRVLVPAANGLVLVIPLALLSVGASMALTAALRQTGAGAALFAVSLCFPGVLSGYLLGTGLQVLKLHDVTSAQEVVDGFVAALHLWALIGGFLVVAVIVLSGLLGRRRVSTAGAVTETAVEVSAAPVAAEGVETAAEPATSSLVASSGSMTSESAASGAVASGSLASGAESSEPVASERVGSEAVASERVGSEAVASGAVASGPVASGVVVSEPVASGAGASGLASSGAEIPELKASGSTDSRAAGAFGAAVLGAEAAHGDASGAATASSSGDDDEPVSASAGVDAPAEEGSARAAESNTTHAETRVDATHAETRVDATHAEIRRDATHTEAREDDVARRETAQGDATTVAQSNVTDVEIAEGDVVAAAGDAVRDDAAPRDEAAQSGTAQEHAADGDDAQGVTAHGDVAEEPGSGAQGPEEGTHAGVEGGSSEGESSSVADDGVPAEVLEALEEEDRPTGEVPRIDVGIPLNGVSADTAEARAEATGPIPVVPPPAQSPEDTVGP
ncbi:hypothetical protein ACIBG8_29210 [Nonomuraea sp. NPDC050556]|uniref:hypothetical protein n=1 Tax=Nonomuraea sp. NPDC050556 TaxID=3364369 RepID=UPI0037AE83EC